MWGLPIYMMLIRCCYCRRTWVANCICRRYTNLQTGKFKALRNMLWWVSYVQTSRTTRGGHEVHRPYSCECILRIWGYRITKAWQIYRMILGWNPNIKLNMATSSDTNSHCLGKDETWFLNNPSTHLYVHIVLFTGHRRFIAIITMYLSVSTTAYY